MGPPGASTRDSFVLSYTLSCAAATIAEAATYPLDLTKTRLQIQGEQVQAAKNTRRNAAKSTIEPVKRGMLRTAYGIVYTGARIGVYEHLREHIFHRNPDGTFSVWFRNMWHAFRSVLSQNGVIGLWKGWIPNCQRAALVNMADLATYDKVKHELLRRTSLQDNYILHGLSSAFAGLSAAIASTPADVVKTRIMNQPQNSVGQ